MHILVFMQNRGRGNRRGNRRGNWRGQSIAKQNRIRIFFLLPSFLTFAVISHILKSTHFIRLASFYTPCKHY